MGRAIDIEAGPRKRHVKVNGQTVPHDECADLRIEPGDQITLTSDWVPTVTAELLPGEGILAVVASEPSDDVVVVADNVVGWDLQNTVNGHAWLWWVPLDDDSDPVMRPVDFARAATVTVSSDWGGSWHFTLMFGSGVARLAAEEDGAEIEAVVVPQSVPLDEALIALADRVNGHEELSSRGHRRFSMCKACASSGVGSRGLADGEEKWEITCEVDSRCDDRMKALLLSALWTPCPEHRAKPVTNFGQIWSWDGTGWSLAASG